MNKRIVVGSNAFFSKYEDFCPHDNDILILVDNPTEFCIQRQIRLQGNCYFEWKRMSAQQMIDYHKKCACAMFVGKFLVPEFIQEINLTIDQLRQLQPLIDKLDEKHTYEKIIYEAYLSNNDFYLTDAQLDEAYRVYKISHSLTPQ